LGERLRHFLRLRDIIKRGKSGLGGDKIAQCICISPGYAMRHAQCGQRGLGRRKSRYRCFVAHA
jgi:hypothetical protein